MFFADTYTCRIGTVSDKEEILSGLNMFHTHQHLDWESLSNQIESQSVFLCYRNHQLSGILSLSGSLPDNHWVKIFAVRNETQKHIIWQKLLSFLFSSRKPHTFYTIAFWDWYKSLIRNLPEFTVFDQIITLEISGLQSPQSFVEENEIRVITQQDYLQITHIDQAAFTPPWQLDQNNLVSAINKSTISECILVENQPVGYLLADYDQFSAHLSRIAVHPDCAGQGLASQLINFFIRQLVSKHIYICTVNTQEKNTASLALYHKFGFQRNGDKIPVFRYNVF